MGLHWARKASWSVSIHAHELLPQQCFLFSSYYPESPPQWTGKTAGERTDLKVFTNHLRTPSPLSATDLHQYKWSSVPPGSSQNLFVGCFYSLILLFSGIHVSRMFNYIFPPELIGKREPAWREPETFLQRLDTDLPSFINAREIIYL